MARNTWAGPKRLSSWCFPSCPKVPSNAEERLLSPSGSSSPHLRNARNNIVEDRAYNTRAAKLRDATRLSRLHSA